MKKSVSHFNFCRESGATGWMTLWLGAVVLGAACSDGHAQGSLQNGFTYEAAIAPVGNVDAWTFAANAGERIVVRVGEMSQTNNFSPRIQLRSPTAVVLGTASGALAAEVTVVATNSGTFTVLVDDLAGTAATGTYRLTLAKTGEAVVTAAGDEGGALTNGVMNLAALPTGDLDVWSFTANSGENIVVRAGEVTDASLFSPWVRLYGPNGALLDSGSGSLTGEATFRATNSGTFLVVVADGNASYSGSGTYRLTLAKTGEAVVTSAGDEGGALTNGVMNLAALPTGDLDVWSFTANSGESIVVRAGEVTDASLFSPWVRLYGPNGALLDSGFGSLTGEATFRATNSGTFLVVVADGNASYSGSGTYRLTLAKTGEAVATAAGDEGGALTNGVMNLAALPTGDLDVWSFTASSGDNLVVRLGELTDTNSFTPWVRLYGPNGALLDSGFGSLTGEATFRATNSGTFLVVVADGNASYSGSGTYRLTLAKTGEAVVTAAGDEGGALTNGVMNLAALPTGDLDVWSFNANSGESIVVRLGELTDTNSFTPWVRLYGPNGALLDSGFGSLTGEATFRATNSGTFLVVVADGNASYSGSGTYRLTLAKTGEAVVTAAGDEGGALTNGVMNLAALPTGDLDVWTVTATSGDNLVVRLGELTDTNSFTPWVRLYGPNGALLDSGFGSLTGEATFRATNSGTFLVVVADGNASYSGSGTYRLTLAKTGAAVVTSAGDEGGAMRNSEVYAGEILAGDLDVWQFNACAGDGIVLQATELSGGSSFTPTLRLYAPNGVLTNTASGATTAQISRVAPVTGTYLLLVGDSGGGAGTYQLTGQGVSTGFVLCRPLVIGTNVVIRAVGGPVTSNYVLFTTLDVTVPQASWQPIHTNNFSVLGEFSVTNLFSPQTPARFYRVRTP